MVNHRIAIITHPLQYNYGGVLQAYALSSVLSRYAETVFVLRHFHYTMKDFIKWAMEYVQPFHKFKHRYINEKLVSFANLEKWLKEKHIDTVVVGSDQVWRSDFALNNSTFGQFWSGAVPLNLFAYAASFGTDIWEYTIEQECFLKNEIRKFTNISVREKSGIDLCKRHLNVKAKWVLDPTLLLTEKDYLRFVTLLPNNDSSKHIFAYLLDYNNPLNQSVLQEIVDETKWKLQTIRLIKNKILKRFYPTLSIPSWLTNLYNAEFVVTDSFHGCVFCILFKKNFIVLENARGGNARIESLLDLLGIEKRIIKKVTANIINSLPSIDWKAVDGILDEQREESMSYIENAFK